MKYVESVDGAKIYFNSKIVNSKKPCLVFIHGLAGASPIWNYETDYFKNKGVSTIVIDLRGHGTSTRSDKEGYYKFENFVSDITQVIKNEKVKSYYLIGHCLGGMISLGVATKQPKGLKGIVLIDSIYKTTSVLGSFDNIPLFKAFLNLLAKAIPDLKIEGYEDYESFKGTGSIDLKRGISDILHVSLKAYLLMCESLMGLSLEKLLSKIEVPTLIIEGSEDTLVIPEIAIELNKKIKNSNLKMINGANHFLVINNPDSLTKEIEEFITKKN